MDVVPAAIPHTAVAAATVVGAATRPTASARAAVVAAPETLHPALWLGHQLGRQTEHAVPSGFAALDAQLPGGGWPRRALTELLLLHPGVGEIRLLAGCLAATQAAGRLVMLFDPPAQLSAWALAQLGVEVEQLLVIDTRVRVDGEGTDARRHDEQVGSDARRHDEQVGADARRHDEPAGADARLWALEQALSSGHVGAVLAWLPPRLQADRVRRLQLAAHAHDGPAFVLRETDAARRPSAAPLRLVLHPGGPDVLSLQVLKRRGPPLEAPLAIELPPVLSAAARQRAHSGSTTPGSSNPPPVPALHAATFVNLA